MKKAHTIHIVFAVFGLTAVFFVAILINATRNQIIERQVVEDYYPVIENDADGVVTNNYVADSRLIPDKISDFDRKENYIPPIITPTIKEDIIDNKIVTDSGKTFDLHKYETTALPNDPDVNQWWVSSIGMEQAWDLGRGPNPTTIAIIDTGFDLNHEELVGRWFSNDGEIGLTTSENPSDLNCSDQLLPLDASCNNIDDNYDGIVDNETGSTWGENPSRYNCSDQLLALDKSCNLIDDDGNGLIDDWRGWDFANFDGFVEAGETNPGGSETNHGTMVAGVAAGSGNNGVGIAGVDWGATILPIQVFDDDGYADTAIISRAIRYAADMGADVINLSLGTSFYDSYLRLAISYAIDVGSLVVASAGNSPCNCMVYPANFPEVIAVGASNSSGNRANFSSYGANLDLLAPGSSIRTSSWSVSSDSQYSIVSGTSFSSPIVAGLLSIARSYYPEATWTELVAALLENTDRSLLSVNEAFSSNYGFGIGMANGLLTRLNTPINLQQKYLMSPLGAVNQLSSTNVYQCEAGQFGATSLYELKKSGQYKYTVNQQERYQHTAGGWTSRLLGYACLGLPGDSASEIRILNMALEFSNVNQKPAD